jgi:hypothetical protein
VKNNIIYNARPEILSELKADRESLFDLAQNRGDYKFFSD